MGWRGWKAGQLSKGVILAPPLWFASGFCPYRQRKKTLLVAMDRACPESGTSRGPGQGGPSLLCVLVDGSLRGLEEEGLAGGFWMSRLRKNTLQMEMGLGYCALPVTLTWLSSWLPLGSSSGPSYAVCLR